jgi:hypothetical protein
MLDRIKPSNRGPLLTDVQERTKPESEAPYPQPLEAAPNPRMFLATRYELQPTTAANFDVPIEPQYWLVYARRGLSSDGFYVSPGGEGSQQLWQQADKAIKVPGIGTRLSIMSDADNTLYLYIVACSNCVVDV